MSTIEHGFELLADNPLPELGCNLKSYRHVRTGARLVSAVADDPNKVFGVSFRTPVGDSSGIAHILEHSVLCGSERYPVKKPFLEMLRNSMHTFLNAFTALDRTIYPVASLNLRSFRNLVSVYLDAVFHPLLTEAAFEQEGWHLDLEEVDGPLQYRGVVYNEMKGAQANPHSVLMRASTGSLFEDHPYAHDSGGVAHEIRELTYPRLKDFHARHYHPSNAWLFFYGDDDPRWRLETLDSFFEEFRFRADDTRVPLYPLAATRRTVELPFSPIESGQETEKGFITANWLLPEIDEPLERFLVGITSSCLLGSQSAPLYKALIDSGLGESVVAGGFSFDLRQPMFTVGLEGVEPDRFDRVTALIEEILSNLADTGFDDDLIEAVINSKDFAHREFGNSSFPKGLAIMAGMLSGQMHGGKRQSATLGFQDTLKQARDRIEWDPDVLTRPLRIHLLDNPHRSTVRLVPDTGAQDAQRRAERERLDELEACLAPSEREGIRDRSLWLRQYQTEPDSPEALASLPVLNLSDIDKETREYPCEEIPLDGVRYLSHDIATNGIVYVSLLFDLHHLPEELLDHVELFADALRQTGAGALDHVAFSRRISGTTGGIGVATDLHSKEHGEEAAAHLVVGGKCLVHQMEDMVNLLEQMLRSARLDSRDRVRQLATQARSHAESSLLPSGHSFVGCRLAANHSEADWFDEVTGGIAALQSMRTQADNFIADWERTAVVLEEIRTRLFTTDNLLVSVTAPSSDQSRLRELLRPVLERLPDTSGPCQRWQRTQFPEEEGLVVPAPVQFVGRTYDLRQAGYAHHGSMAVAARLINTSWLWANVREQGGAYGCSAGYNRHTGQFSCVSYRDPNVAETLGVYDAIPNFLDSAELSDQDLIQLIVGTFGSLDRDLQPRAQGQTALARFLTGSTRDMRQQRRAQILETRPEHVRTLAGFLQEAGTTSNTVVMGSAEALDKAETSGAVRFRARTVL